MSPLELKIIMHYHTTPRKYDGIENESFIQVIVDMFINLGLMVTSDYEGLPSYKLTEGGGIYIARILETPLPVKKTTWVFSDQ